MSPDAFFQWRRRLLIAGGCAVVTPALGAPPPQSAADEALKGLLAERRSIWLVRGGEQVEATYWSAERGYDRAQYLQLCWALRDVQADRVFPIDHGLLDVLSGLQAWLAKSGLRAPLEVHSGYRTRSTNQKLEGSALNSRHLLGKAADITVPGVKNVKLAGMASVLGRGGTGFYPGRNFVHVDTGDERVWVSRPKPG
ncbi:MAG: YcbK family protein [Burkholderiaceae bacterium]